MEYTIPYKDYHNKPGCYSITNTVNGKVYIGCSNRMYDRWNNHRQDLRNNRAHNPHLQNAWNKYGETAFEFKPIIFCEKEFLDDYEIKLIKLYKTQDKNVGYNAVPGGKRICGKDHHMFGKKQTPEWLKMIKERMTGKNNPFYGVGPGKDAIAKSIEINNKPVIQIDKDTGKVIKEFESVSEAAKYLDMNYGKSRISNVCNGKKYRHSAYGYKWKFKDSN